MKRIIISLKEFPLNGYVIIITMAFYCINRFFLKTHTVGWLNYILRCHFNDFLCGALFTAYSNVFLNTRHALLNKLPHILAYCFCAGLVWEFVAPFVRKDSISDWLDILCYMLGGIAYWLALRLWSRSNSRGKNDY